MGPDWKSHSESRPVFVVNVDDALDVDELVRVMCDPGPRLAWAVL